MGWWYVPCQGEADGDGALAAVPMAGNCRVRAYIGVAVGITVVMWLRPRVWLGGAGLAAAAAESGKPADGVGKNILDQLQEELAQYCERDDNDSGVRRERARLHSLEHRWGLHGEPRDEWCECASEEQHSEE